MSINELRNKTLDELKKVLLDSYREQFNLRMQKGIDESARPHLFKKVRREIAQIKTLMREQEGAQ